MPVFQDPCFNSWLEATKAVNTRELFGRALGLEMTNILLQLPETKRYNLVYNSNLLLKFLAELKGSCPLSAFTRLVSLVGHYVG